MGCSIKNLTSMTPRLAHINKIQKAYLGRKYMLYPNVGDRVMYVLLRESGGVDDSLCAYFHAVLLAITVCALNNETLMVLEQDADDQRPFARVCRTLQAGDWSRVTTETVGFSGFKYEPSVDLIKFMDDIVQAEWRRFRGGLVQTGWDISKHLLLSDDWRISCHAFELNGICSSDYEDTLTRSVRIVPDMNLPIVKHDSKDLSDGLFIIEPDEQLVDQSKITVESKQEQLRSNSMARQCSYSTIQKESQLIKRKQTKPIIKESKSLKDDVLKQESIIKDESKEIPEEMAN